MKSVLAMLAAAVLWSTGGLFIKIIALDAMSLSTWRSLVAAVTMLVLAELRGQRMQVTQQISDLLLKSVDVMRDMLAASWTGQMEDAWNELLSLIDRLLAPQDGGQAAAGSRS